MITREQTELITARLPVSDIKTITDLMYKTGSLSRSASLRQIIREWAEMKQERENKESKAKDGGLP